MILLNSNKKKKEKSSGECEACDVLGDYMCPGTPEESPGQDKDKRKK
ncbi:MAG: hypothetical protein ACYDEQ_13115 [Desulfocucumaceae bacterium]